MTNFICHITLHLGLTQLNVLIKHLWLTYLVAYGSDFNTHVNDFDTTLPHNSNILAISLPFLAKIVMTK